MRPISWTEAISPGPRLTGVASSHDLGGAVFPTCPGINPTLALWALCYRAAERLVKRLKSGEEL